MRERHRPDAGQTPARRGSALVDAGVGSQAVAALEADDCPLPDDPLLAEMASSLRDTGHWAEIVDPEWRIVYTTDQLRLAKGFMVESVPLTLGMHMFGAECIHLHERSPGARNTVDTFREILASIGEWVLADTATYR